MNVIKRLMLRSFALSFRACERVSGLKKYVLGGQHLVPGAKIVATNHVTSHDGFHIMTIFREPTHLVIGPGFRSPIIARLLDYFEQINALHGDSDHIVCDAVKYLAKGEPVLIAPEGDIQEPFHLGRFYPGVARIYRAFAVPIVPMALLVAKRCLREDPKRSYTQDGHEFRFVTAHGGPYCICVGEPWLPDCSGKSDAKAILYITRGLKERIAALMEDARQHEIWQ